MGQSCIDKITKEWEDTKPTINDIYQEMGRYKLAHLKLRRRIEAFLDILEEIESLIKSSDGLEDETKIFENEDVSLTYIYRMSDAIMGIMRPYVDLTKEIEACTSMWEHLRGELSALNLTRDYARERLDLFKKSNKND